jgi:hypothetical protein
MTLSNYIEFPALFSLRKMTSWNFINSGIQQSAVAFAPQDDFTLLGLRKLTFRSWQNAESQGKWSEI